MFHATVLEFTTDLARLFDPRAVADHRPVDGAAQGPGRLLAVDDAVQAAGPAAGASVAERHATAALSVPSQARDGAHSVVCERIAAAPAVLAMMADEDWCLGELHRRRARALVDYWRRVDDKIPDRTPVIGLLDDPILVDRWAAALRDELDDWRDFRDYREEIAAARGVPVAGCHPSRQQWLAGRARAFARARRLREARRAGYYARTPQPIRFRVG